MISPSTGQRRVCLQEVLWPLAPTRRLIAELVDSGQESLAERWLSAMRAGGDEQVRSWQAGGAARDVINMQWGRAGVLRQEMSPTRGGDEQVRCR